LLLRVIKILTRIYSAAALLEKTELPLCVSDSRDFYLFPLYFSLIFLPFRTGPDDRRQEFIYILELLKNYLIDHNYILGIQ
jgi:hypothetical protein